MHSEFPFGYWNHWVSYATVYNGRRPHMDFLRSQWKLIKKCKEENGARSLNYDAADVTCDYVGRMLFRNY